jgi:hypothetical protein
MPTSAKTIARGDQFIKMKGKEVFKLAVRVMEEAARDILEQHGLQAHQIDLVIPHQANLRIIDAIAQYLELPIERFFVNVDRYGNTSAASIPIALDEARRRRADQAGRPHAPRGIRGRLDLRERPDSLVISALMPISFFPPHPTPPLDRGGVRARRNPRLSADLTWSPQRAGRSRGRPLRPDRPAGQGGPRADEQGPAARRTEASAVGHQALREGRHQILGVRSTRPEALYRAGLLYVREAVLQGLPDYQKMMAEVPEHEALQRRDRRAVPDRLGASSTARTTGLWGWHPEFSNRTRAIEYFEVILINAPYSDYAPLALMDAARGYQLGTRTRTRRSTRSTGW